MVRQIYWDFDWLVRRLKATCLYNQTHSWSVHLGYYSRATLVAAAIVNWSTLSVHALLLMTPLPASEYRAIRKYSIDLSDAGDIL